MKVGIELDHAKALAIYKAAGHSFPVIPDGCNTVWHHFTTTDGFPAVIVNQSGHKPIASDNEEQVNGCSVAIALDAPDKDTAMRTLEKWVTETLDLT